jgi:uncharacterized DUF497 family protein
MPVTNEKHGVSVSEAEQVFFNQPLLLLDGVKHSQDEPRFHALCEKRGTSPFPQAYLSLRFWPWITTSALSMPFSSAMSRC